MEQSERSPAMATGFPRVWSVPTRAEELNLHMARSVGCTPLNPWSSHGARLHFGFLTEMVPSGHLHVIVSVSVSKIGAFLVLFIIWISSNKGLNSTN